MVRESPVGRKLESVQRVNGWTFYLVGGGQKKKKEGFAVPLPASLPCLLLRRHLEHPAIRLDRAAGLQELAPRDHCRLRDLLARRGGPEERRVDGLHGLKIRLGEQVDGLAADHDHGRLR